MSLGVGAGVGIGQELSGINGRVIIFGNVDNASTSNGFVPPNARGKGSSFTDSSIEMSEAGKINYFAVKAIAKSAISRDVVISINNVDLEASRLTFTAAGLQVVALNQELAKGDEISIHLPAGGSSTDDFAWSLDVTYGSSDDLGQQITESTELTCTTVFTRASYSFFSTNASHNPVDNIPPYSKKMLKLFAYIITAPTLGDSVVLTRRIGASGIMTGTVNLTITDAESDGTFFELEDDIPFSAGDELNLGYVRVGTAGVTPIIKMITVWDWT